jgi:sirohydrochlorin cobaltochelatase
MNASTLSGLILFAHGSRDSKWRQPFESMLAQIKCNNAQLSALAFLECMTPSLPEAIDEMVARGVRHITVIPVFLAVGSHVRQDLPLLLEHARQKHPALHIQASAAIGEQPEIQAAIARFALKAATTSPAVNNLKD